MHQFINIVFAYIVGLPTFQTAEAEYKLTAFLTENGLKPIYETLFYQLIATLHDSIKHHHSADYIEKQLQGFELTAEHSAVIKKSYGHNVQVITQLFNENIFKISRLLDIEWRFGVTTSNSQLAQVGTCWLQLKIKRTKESGAENAQKSENGEKDGNDNVKMNTVQYDIVEMSLQQFYAFLTMLQQAAGQIAQWEQ